MEWTTETSNNVDTSQKHYVERKQPNIKEYILYDFIYMIGKTSILDGVRNWKTNKQSSLAGIVGWLENRWGSRGMKLFYVFLWVVVTGYIPLSKFTQSNTLRFMHFIVGKLYIDF